MTNHPTRRSVVLAPAAAALAPAWAAAANPLAAERWKTRPLVAVVPRADEPLLVQVQDALRTDADVRAAFAERDMVLFTVVAGVGQRNGRPLPPGPTRALLAALGLRADGPPTLVLVGKDGGAKLTQGPRADLAAVFAEIDRMPMRQR